MLTNRKKKRLPAIIAIIIILSGILFLPVIFSLSNKLSETKRVDANILLVEGWIPPYGLKMAFNEFKKNGYDYIVTTGLKSTSDYFCVYTNGSLIFYTSGRLLNENDIASHTIEIKAFSSLGDEDCARFSVLINDSVAANFIADKRKRSYTTNWKGRLSKIDSVSVKFLNDLVGVNGDRNLFIKEILFDHKIKIPYQLNSIYTYPETDRIVKIKNDFVSYAQLARNSLLALGVDSSLVIDIAGEKVSLNRTLTSALAFRNWLRKTDINVKGINIVTMGAHAERTFMTYNKILDKKYEIGIISLPDYDAIYSKKYKVFKTIRESIGIVYYWVILLFY
jgi:hypothetical protein